MTSEFKYGLGTGALVCVWILLQYAFGLHTTHVAIGAYAGYISNLIPVLGMFLLLRKKQRGIWDGRLSFARGIFSGVQMAIISALVVYSFLAVYHTFINPYWIDHMLEWKVAQLRATHQPEVAIQNQITLFRDAYSPLGIARSTLLGMTLFGSVLSLLITALLRILPTPRTE